MVNSKLPAPENQKIVRIRVYLLIIQFTEMNRVILGPAAYVFNIDYCNDELVSKLVVAAVVIYSF